MTTREALAEINGSGLNLTIWEIRGLLQREAIPRPRMNSSLQWDWTSKDVQAAVQAIQSGRKPEPVPA